MDTKITKAGKILKKIKLSNAQPVKAGMEAEYPDGILGVIEMPDGSAIFIGYMEPECLQFVQQ